MTNSATGAFAAAALMAMALASARAQSPAAPAQTAPGASQTLPAPFTPDSAPNGADAGPGQSHPLFMIGNLPVVVWAPVEPPYNANMNRSGASDPVFDPSAN